MDYNFKIFYIQNLVDILEEMKDLSIYPTNHFEGFFKDGKRRLGFVGKERRLHLIKCLKCLQNDGYIISSKTINNTYVWQITELGLTRTKQ